LWDFDPHVFIAHKTHKYQINLYENAARRKSKKLDLQLFGST